MSAAMTRDDERRQARELLLTALGATPDQGLSEAVLRRTTNLSTSLFHEVLPDLLGEGLVVVSHGDGRRTQTEYHLVRIQEILEPFEGPVSPLAILVLTRLGNRAEGARALAKTLDLETSVVQLALDELEGFQLVKRTQVGMLVIYRKVNTYYQQIF